MSTIDLTFGNQNGRIVHVREVERGLACDCTCPRCGSRLIARQGSVRAWHFAHYQAPECSFALETAVHRLAKEVIEQRLRFTVPSLIGRLDGGREVALLPVGRLAFDAVTLEQRTHDIIPDVIASRGERSLFIEIAVTHFVGQGKRQRICELGISTVEVDMRALVHDSFDRKAFAKALVDGVESKSWVYHALAAELLQTEQERIEREAAEEEARRRREIKRRRPGHEKKTSFDRHSALLVAQQCKGDLWRVYGCPLRKRVLNGSGRDSPYADLHRDCVHCSYFHGWLDEQKKEAIVCLGLWLSAVTQSRPVRVT